MRGKKDRQWTYHWDDGTKLKDESWEFTASPMARSTYYDAEGRGARHAHRLVHGTEPWIEYDRGTLVATGAYANAEKDGAWVEGLERGAYKAAASAPASGRSPMRERREAGRGRLRRGGQRDGAWTYWLPDGTVLATGRFRDGERAGTWTISDPAHAGSQTLVFRNGKLVTVDGAPATRGNRDSLRVLVNFDDKPGFVGDQEGLPFGMPDGASSASRR